MAKKTNTKTTLTYNDARIMASVLSASISPDAIEGMTHDKKSKALFRLGKTHGKLVSSLKYYTKEVEAIQDKNILLDSDGEKVANIERVKNEETGEWEDKENGFKIADQRAFARELTEISEEEVDVELSMIPLSWLDGNTNLGGIASACSMMVAEDE